MRNPTVVRSPAARETFDIQPMRLGDAIMRPIEAKASVRYKVDTRAIAVDAPPARAFAPIRRIGGATGLKLRGRGWLEFRVTALGEGARSLITQTATFDPKSVGGRLYWYGVFPFHALLFRGLLHGIARRVTAVALAAAATLQPGTAHAKASPPVRTVPFVNLDRYAGDWFEIARLPNQFQRQCVGDVRASYARQPDGRIAVVNRCQTAEGRSEARGVARVVDQRSCARLKVRFAPAWLSFVPAVWGDYWVIGLAEDYSWAVVGSPDRQYLWILGRRPRLDQQDAAAALAVARENGFDITRLVQTSHTESD